MHDCHAPVHIGEQKYSYDANGNQTGWTHDVSGQRRQIIWDEENRICAIADNGSAHHYIYDASGTRVLKGKSNGQSIRVNGEWKAGSGNMGNYTVYVNPYLVLRSGGYTKHYYIEGQRIVSKLGSGLNNKGKGPLKAGSEKVNYSKKQQDSREGIVKNLKWLGQDGQLLTAGNSGKTPPGQLKKIKGGSDDGSGKGKDKGGKDAEKFQYFYHPDHLGSTSYITDASGEVYQHLEYFAFGETFVEEHSNRKHTPYKFNGKELDEETGLYYYGARYYDAKTSIFISTDPHMESYPGWTPYNYCANNPVNITDPTGMDWYDIDGNITWHDNEGDLTIGDKTYTSLGVGFTRTNADGQNLYYGANGESASALNEVTISAKHIEKATVGGVNPTAATQDNTVNPASTPWMDVANQEHEKGVAEIQGNSHNPRIIEYLKSAGLSGDYLKDETAWCASFLHWSMSQAGMKGAGARGANWSTWGQPLDGPTYGAIAIFKTGHVGLVAGQNGNNLIMLHGNWSNRIDLSNYIKPAEISTYRYPSGYTPAKKFP